MEQDGETTTQIRTAFRDFGRAALHESNGTPVGVFLGAEVIPMAAGAEPVINPDLAGSIFLAAIAINTAYRYLRS